MHDHRVLDGEAERVLRGERECLAGVDHRGNGDAADGVGHDLELNGAMTIWGLQVRSRSLEG